MDWTNNANPSRIVYKTSVIESVGVVPGVGAVIGGTASPFSVGDLEALGFEVIAQSGNGKVVFTFYADPAATIRINSDVIKLSANPSEQASWTIPVSGPFLVISATANTGTFTFTIRLWADVVQSYIFNNDTVVPNPLILFTADDVSLPVGDSFFNGANVLPGPASFLGVVNAASTRIRLYAADGPGTLLLLAECDNPGAGGGSPAQMQLVMLPPMHLTLKVTNNTAVNQLFSYSLVSKYGLL